MMSNDNINQLVYSRHVVEFVAVANEYCNLIESAAEYPPQQLIEITRKILPLLYFKASLVPECEKLMDEEPEKYVTELDYNLHLQRWLRKLGEHDLFHEVFDPELQFGSETVTASISEHLLDIYQDLKDFVVSYSLGDEAIMNDSISECNTAFRDRWGQRLVNVLRALHNLFVTSSGTIRETEARDQANSGTTHKGNWVNRYFDNQQTQ